MQRKFLNVSDWRVGASRGFLPFTRLMGKLLDALMLVGCVLASWRT
jgi:hypothetical protein